MANNIQWTAISNSQSKAKNKHIILVGYQPTGMGSMNEVCAVLPMYDMRDMDLSGSVSVLEAAWAAATKWIDPLYVFKLINESGKSSCVADSATQMKDYFLYQSAMVGALEATFKVRQEILTAVLMKSFLSAHIGGSVNGALTLANCGVAELIRMGGVGTFIIKTALEKVIMTSILSTNK
jgi:hypothetical protein